MAPWDHPGLRLTCVLAERSVVAGTMLMSLERERRVGNEDDRERRGVRGGILECRGTLRQVTGAGTWHCFDWVTS